MKFNVEWQDAPGVRDEALARSWARLSVSAADGTPLIALLADEGQYREGVYLSVLPLALWLVENYWAILWEPPRAPLTRGGRQLGRADGMRPWVQRHSLLAARGGFLLPDLTIARDGAACVLRVAPDQVAARTSARHRFIADALVREPWADVRASIHRFIGGVLERVRTVEGAEPEALRMNWSAVLESEGDEASFCAALARLGIDPYGDDEAINSASRIFAALRRESGESLTTQLLTAASDLDGLRSAAAWVSHVARRHNLDLSGDAVPEAPDDALRPAHDVGSSRAFSLRQDLHLGNDGIELPDVLTRFGLASQVTIDGTRCPWFVRALAARPKGAKRAEVVGPQLPTTHDRFRLARALYGWHFGGGPTCGHLVGTSHERAQRESRAFAAEFLAPWSGIRDFLAREGVTDVAGPKAVRGLADVYKVDPMVIEHQIENHGFLYAADG